MEIVMWHEARQVPSWLIFDVGQKVTMAGFFFGLLVLLALLPLTVWFAIKCVRAAYVPTVKEDFKKRPVLHILWAIASLICLNGVLTWLPAFAGR